MKKKSYSYFETKPEGGLLDKKAYQRSSLVLGRSCLDVCLLVNRQLILVERSVPPARYLWMTGGRIVWNKFVDVYQYAALTASEHFGITTETKKMTLLNPRFICLSERPYPEVVLWVAITISKKTYSKIKLDTTEQNKILKFSKKQELRKYIRTMRIDTLHGQIFLDLWDDLKSRMLLN